MQSRAPNKVGSRAERNVYDSFPVSFFTVMSVVAQGQWKRVKINMESAVLSVQPFIMKSSRKADRSEISVRVPEDR